MEVKLKCGDSITIPEGCKAIVKGESVEIEKAQKFKDGDVLVVVIDDVECPFIFFKTSTEFCCYHIMLRPNGEISRTWFFNISELVYTRHATEEEKRQLFDKMKEKGWQWNAEKKCVELNRWRAKKGKAYCRMGLGGGVFYEIDRRTNANNVFYDTLNYFHTEEQTREAIKRVRETLRQYHEEIGE
jgi:hypothetical protein